MDLAVAISNLSVVLGGKKVIDNISVDIPGGRIIGLLGPSGAGKTTLIRTILGLQKFSAGKVSVLELPAGKKELRSKIGYISQALSIYPDLTVTENVHYFAALINAEDNCEKVIREVELTPHKKRIVRTLSGGEKARAALAIALLGSPQLLLLDEPTVGLDPVLRQKMWHKFSQLAKQGITVVVSSHVMDEADKCDEILFIRDGELLANGTKAGILKQTNTNDMEKAFLKLAEGARK
jgi:ABC-2 type transport system ATP-binding protein